MKKNFVYIGIIMLLAWPGLKLQGQGSNSVEMPITITIPEVAVIDFFSTTETIRFVSEQLSVNQVEQIITPGTEDQTWLNYSSVVKEGASNYISACITAGDWPPQTDIKLKVGFDAGEGAGAVGAPVREIVLTKYPQNIITNIGSCYTGRGLEKGHQLVFSWEWESGFNDTEIDLDQYSVTVAYTIASTE